MKPQKSKILISATFLVVFLLKMAICIAPVFLLLNNKTVNAVIMQLELEGKNEKDASSEKEFAKDKKFFDENLVQHTYALAPVIIETNVLHNQENCLFVQTYHPAVPTPPPNA